jgi:hypothetical protein
METKEYYKYYKLSFSKYVLKKIKDGYCGGGKRATSEYVNKRRPIIKFDFSFYDWLAKLKPDQSYDVPVNYVQYIIWILDAMYSWGFYPKVQVEYERILNLTCENEMKY